MNKLKYFLFIYLINGSCDGQNLVPNPSFEIAISCSYQLDSCQFWHNPTSYTPDYLNACDTIADSSFFVPNNGYGYQQARSGNAYTAIITYCDITSAREYIQAQLLDTLRANTTYMVSFYVSLIDNAEYAVNDIGAFFSDSAISLASPFNIPVQPQINNNPILNPLESKINWMLVQDSFIANGGEKFITIGNFKDNAHTSKSAAGGWYPYGLYYIDDVSVVDAGTLNINESNTAKRFELSPNPFYDLLNIKLRDNERSEIILYDITSRKILQQNFIKSFSINTEQLAKGIYIYELRNNYGVTQTGKIVKE